MTRTGFYVVLNIIASFNMIMFGGDIAGAFMQGLQELAQRELPLFLTQPREGLPGLHPLQLLLVVRGVFGLANSPRLWWRSLRDMFRRLGAKQLSLDRAVFVLYDIVAGILRPVVIVGVHVDDLIGGYSQESPKAKQMIKQLKDTFELGQWQENEDMIYCGKNVTLRPGEIFVSQKMFADNITVPSIPKSRSADPSQ